MDKYQTMKNEVATDPSIHNWVKQLIASLDDKDVVDVLRGLEIAKAVYKAKFDSCK